MASEITATVGMSLTKGALSVSIPSKTIRVDMAGTHSSSICQDIGTSYEALDVGADIATPGFAVFRNLDTDNFVEIGVEVSAAFYPFVKLMPGEFALIPLADISLFAKADTAAVTLQSTILER